MATHAHWDHVAGLAELKRLTGARMAMHERDAPLLEDGGFSDFRFGGEPTFQPVKVDRRLRDGDTVQVGGIAVTVHHHAGHTKGASSFTFTTRDEQRTYRVLVANMGTINDGVTLRAGMPGYPEIAADYERTFAAQRALTADVWVASHASQFGLHRKHKPGDPYDPRRFMDFDRFKLAVNRLDSLYRARLEGEPRQP
jgi:metallo-beta-lactamase class B